MLMKATSKAGGQPDQLRNAKRLYPLLAAHHRSVPTDRVLSCVFAFTAGAINSGGFLAVGQYTSHMTGLLASISDNLIIGAYMAVLLAIAALLLFCAGAAYSALLINYLRRKFWGRQFSGPILLEALLIIGFGALSAADFGGQVSIAIEAGLLCFIMGLQNATITKITRARMRTTHITGILTDIGIQLGNGQTKHNHHLASLPVLRLVLLMFFIGGLTGAILFSTIGTIFCLPLALMLAALALPPFYKFSKN